ncbi:MAG TPA: NYN domain-containing protein [Candidatus Saccharimonadales bacterium]|nr:NYN domain-containing protein [Candidatus Saccharimonadales bacterium]
MQRRTFLVVDGDNLRLCARNRGENLAWIRLLRYLREEFAADRRELFVTYRDEEQLEYWSRICRLALYYFSPYKVMSDDAGALRGYPDQCIIDLIWQNMHEYDRFVLVSSDRDFDSVLRDLHGLDKETVLITDRRHESEWRPRELADHRVELAELLPHFSLTHPQPELPVAYAS